ncbi:MAG: CinA family nicotinamide mononucleotide deamidase-related protein [Planctomycetota bacterium]
MSDTLARAAIVAVGDELLAGAHRDQNGPEIAQRLAAHGIPVGEVRVVSDDEEAIAAAIGALLAPGTLVVVTGGLGPTLDDVTRHGVARALNLPLDESGAALREIEAWFAARGLPVGEANRRQALVPRGAAIVPNRAGTAPGFRVAARGGHVVALPGPPRELAVVLAEEVLPWLERDGLAGEAFPTHRFHLFGLAESAFAERVGAWMDRDADPRMGCTAAQGVLTVVLRAGARSEESRRRLAARVDEVRARVGGHVFSETTPLLEEVLGAALLAGGISVTTAESCTAGLVAARLGGVPGISAVFAEGTVAYANAAKTRALGVAVPLLAAHGAVSGPVAEAMAAGAARRTGARLALAVTGIAGPSGGTLEKPVGLVWFATSLDGELASASRRFPPRDRQGIRSLAATAALFLAWRRLRDAGLAPPPFPGAP